jgi:hypothetical protein
MLSRFDGLPVELQLLVGQHMGADATPKDWIRAEQVCCGNSVGVDDLLMEWVASRYPGERFGEFEGTREEVSFVSDHVQGVYLADGDSSRLL